MCACKQGSSVKKQVTSVKQVVKKPEETYSSSNPNPATKKVMVRKIVFKRHM